MKHLNRAAVFLPISGLACLLILAGGARAEEASAIAAAPHAPAVMAEPENTGWSFYIDNDIFSPKPRDQDYTGGMSLTLAGQRAADWPVSLDPLLGGINNLFGMVKEDREAGINQMHSLQIGVAAFTPGNIMIADVIPGDRPYAGLIYLANSRLTLDARHPDTAQQTTLIVGVLGSTLLPDVQNISHRALGSDEPQGWDHQISDGGEPTFRYSYALQHLWASGGSDNRRYEIKPSFEAGAGFITDANVSLSVRWGKISTPWWSFSPDRSEYFSQPTTGLSHEQRALSRELYVWTGAKLKVRPYNAFLQGQFRHSDLTYGEEDIYPVMVEAWLGVTGQVSRNYWLSWVLRYQSPELRVEPGDRSLVWGSIFINRYF